MSSTIQQNTNAVIRVHWNTKIDGKTTWTSSDPSLLDVEADTEDSERATISADETGLGYVEIYATANKGDRKVTAIHALSVIEGETEQGTIEPE